MQPHIRFSPKSLSPPLAILLVIIVCLRIPSWFEPLWYGDEGITLVTGWAMRQEQQLYGDIADNKPPLLYLLAALFPTLFWLKVFLTGYVLVTIGAFWALVTALTDPLRGWVRLMVTGMFGWWMSVPTLEGNLINGEIFFVGPTIVGVYGLTCVLKRYGFWSREFKTRQPSLQIRTELPLITAGICMAMAVLFKIPAITDWIGIAYWGLLLWWQQPARLVWLAWGGQFLVGMLIPFGLIGGWLWSLGSLSAAIDHVLVDNARYVEVWNPVPLWSWMSSQSWGATLSQRLLVAVILSIGLSLLRKKMTISTLLICLWTVWALLGATLSGRPYPHYLLQVVAPLCLLSIPLIRGRGWERVSVVTLVLVFVLMFGRLGFWHYPTIRYYQNSLLYLLGQKSQTDYYAHFDSQVNQIYALAKWIQTRSTTEEHLFVWAEYAQLYLLANRLPITPLTTAYNIVGHGAVAQSLTQIRVKRPRFIVVENQHTPVPAELRALIDQDYHWEHKLATADIYELN